MTFQFTCPQGHVLQTEDINVGQTIPCPQCGMAFVIPKPGGVPEPGVPVAGDEAGSPVADEEFPSLRKASGRFEYLDELHGDAAGADDGGPPQIATTGAALEKQLGAPGPKEITVPCPNGHLLTTPYETMGDETLCPYCGAQFVLAYSESLEFQREQQRREDTYNRRLGQKWMTWAVVAACGVVVLIIALIVAATS